MNKFRLKDTVWMAYPLLVIYLANPYLFWTYKYYIDLNLFSKIVFIILLFLEVTVAVGLFPSLWRFIYTNFTKVYVIVEDGKIIIPSLFKPFKASKFNWRLGFDFSTKELTIEKEEIADIKLEPFNIAGTWFNRTVRIYLKDGHQLNLLQAYFDSDEVFEQFVETLRDKSAESSLKH